MKKIAIAAVAASVLLASCAAPPPSAPAQPSFVTESKTLEQNAARLVTSTPAPRIEESLERANIAKRAELFNKSDKISYVYLVSFGKVMAFHTAKGKISSVSSYLTPQERLVNHEGRDCEIHYSTNGGYAVDCMAVQAPDIDGSYWTNGDGIFFFTTEGAYVEWKGEYMVSDQPLRLVTPPEIVSVTSK